MCQLWIAVTRYRFSRRADLSVWQNRAQRFAEGCAAHGSLACEPSNETSVLIVDGDKSPAESDDESSHSKALRAIMEFRGEFPADQIAMANPHFCSCHPTALGVKLSA
jgi:hypothetical protein